MRSRATALKKKSGKQVTHIVTQGLTDGTHRPLHPLGCNILAVNKLECGIYRVFQDTDPNNILSCKMGESWGICHVSTQESVLNPCFTEGNDRSPS
jgi:hypothetical protein